MLQRPPDSSALSAAHGSGIDAVTTRSIPERSDLVLAFARVLQVNGQSTHETLAAAARLSKSVGLDTTIIPHWEDLQIQATEGGARLVSLVDANPTGVNMARVASAMKAIGEAEAGRLPMAGAMETIGLIAQMPASPTWLFTVAAAAGAAALSVIFGVQHLAAVALIVVSAATGAVLRRMLSHYSTNTLL